MEKKIITYGIESTISKSLPKEIDITDEFDVNDYEDDEDKLLDDISDWLSDTYGYCHFGFEIER